MKTIEPCSTCGRARRPRTTKVAQYPGTVAMGAGSLCATCYMRNRREDSGVRQALRSSMRVAEAKPADSPAVLVRIDVTTDTYRTLTQAGLDAGLELSRYADRLAKAVKQRAAVK